MDFIKTKHFLLPYIYWYQANSTERYGKVLPLAPMSPDLQYLSECLLYTQNWTAYSSAFCRSEYKSYFRCIEGDQKLRLVIRKYVQKMFWTTIRCSEAILKLHLVFGRCSKVSFDVQNFIRCSEAVEKYIRCMFRRFSKVRCSEGVQKLLLAFDRCINSFFPCSEVHYQ